VLSRLDGGVDAAAARLMREIRSYRPSVRRSASEQHPPKTVMIGSDKHELTCDNGMADSWATGWDLTTADLPGVPQALTATRRRSPNSNSTP
jgi:hypothetical protein